MQELKGRFRLWNGGQHVVSDRRWLRHPLEIAVALYSSWYFPVLYIGIFSQRSGRSNSSRRRLRSVRFGSIYLRLRLGKLFSSVLLAQHDGGRRESGEIGDFYILPQPQPTKCS